MSLSPVKMATSKSDLMIQCLEFSQALENKGRTFKLAIQARQFSFFLDTRGTNTNTKVVDRMKKKLSPSQVRRNQRRKEEFLRRKEEFLRRKEEFLRRKSESPNETNPLVTETPESDTEVVEKTAEQVIKFKCDQCGKSCKSENGLKIHVGKAHKKEDASPQEKKRGNSQEVELTVSPVKDTRAEPEGSDNESTPTDNNSDTDDSDQEEEYDPNIINGLDTRGLGPRGLFAAMQQRRLGMS